MKLIKIWINGSKLWVAFTDVFTKKKKEINVYNFFNSLCRKRNNFFVIESSPILYISVLKQILLFMSCCLELGLGRLCDCWEGINENMHLAESDSELIWSKS